MLEAEETFLTVGFTVRTRRREPVCRSEAYQANYNVKGVGVWGRRHVSTLALEVLITARILAWSGAKGEVGLFESKGIRWW
jgi:hypothetical protein